MAGEMLQVSGAGATANVQIGGTVVRSIATTSAGQKATFHNQRDPDASGQGTGVETFE